VIKFLFWNLNGKPLQDRLARLVHNHDIDVVVLVECAISSHDLLDLLNDDQETEYIAGWTLLETVAVLARFPQRSFRTLEEDESIRLSMRQLILPSGKDILLVATHSSSKLYQSPESQSQDCTRLASVIRNREQKLGHSRTVLVGDLNMNPFEPGVVSCHGLHGVMARQTAERESRMIKGQDYQFFYNPMWGHFGDGLDGPPGTYYNSRAESVCYFWNIFDQVMVRPSLLSAFNNGDLRILDSDGTDSLLTGHGLPDGAFVSDHLPIVFALDL
jgi:endonuclease/exonuclease/phosphatase family metal-dependent hydrolase